MAGNYHYECHPAFSHGEPGYIVVSAPTGISSIAPNPVSLVYPNPFTNKITIETPAAETVVVYNVVGEKIKSIALNAQTKIEIDMTEFTAGIYFYAVIKEGVAVETKRMIKN